MASILKERLGNVNQTYIAPGEAVPEMIFLLRRIFLLYNYKTWAAFARDIGAHPMQMYKWRSGRGKPSPKYFQKMMEMILTAHAKKVMELQTKVAALQEHEIPCSYCPVGNLLKNVSTT